MLNQYSKTYTNSYNNLNINAVSGTLVKSHPKSFFKTYHITSDTGTDLNKLSECFDWEDRKKKKCVIIQSMIVGDGVLMSEIVWINDYLKSEE